MDIILDNFLLLVVKNRILYDIMKKANTYLFRLGNIRTVYDIKYYKEILKECNYPDSPTVRHFPPEIHKSAYNVKMVYYRSFLQGDQSLKLCMTLDDSDFESTLKRFGIEKEALLKEKKILLLMKYLKGKHRVKFLTIGSI